MTNAPATRTRSPWLAPLIWIAAGIAALLVVGVLTAVTWPPHVVLSKPAELWGDGVTSSEGSGDTLTPRDRVFTDMNAAMLAKDRDGFLAHTTGDATAQLGQWWDNTQQIGWDTAAITPWDDTTVLLGAQLAFAAHPERGSGDEDAGLQLIQGFYYSVTWEENLLSSITPYYEPMPWDEGPIHVARAEHVVLFGAADEAALVDATLADAEAGAVRALDFVDSLGTDLPADGFVSAVTDSDERMYRWQYGSGEGWEMEVAGFAMPTSRPARPEPWLDPVIATGDGTSGTVVALGPKSTQGRESIFTHEFLHALHNTAAPRSEQSPTFASAEGFAEWGTSRAGIGETYYTYPEVKEAIASSGAAAFSDEALRAREAWIAYSAAASYYEFVDRNGGNAWRLALDSQSTGEPLPTLSVKQNPALTEAAWQAWVAEQ